MLQPVLPQSLLQPFQYHNVSRSREIYSASGADRHLDLTFGFAGT